MTPAISAIWRYILLKKRDYKKLSFQFLDPILAYGTISPRIIITMLHLQLDSATEKARVYGSIMEQRGLLPNLKIKI